MYYAYFLIVDPATFGPFILKEGTTTSINLANDAQLDHAVENCHNKVQVTTNLDFKLKHQDGSFSGVANVTYLRTDTFKIHTHEITENGANMCLKYKAGSMMCRSTDASLCEGVKVNTTIPAIILSIFIEPKATEIEENYKIEGSHQEVHCNKKKPEEGKK